MDNQQLAVTLHQMARHDQFDNIGRLFLSEAKTETHQQNLTYEAIEELWLKFYPCENIDESCGVIRVYFDGKVTVQNRRRTLEPSNFTLLPDCNPKDNESSLPAAGNEYPDPDVVPATKPDENNVIW